MVRTSMSLFSLCPMTHGPYVYVSLLTLSDDPWYVCMSLFSLCLSLCVCLSLSSLSHSSSLSFSLRVGLSVCLSSSLSPSPYLSHTFPATLFHTLSQPLTHTFSQPFRVKISYLSLTHTSYLSLGDDRFSSYAAGASHTFFYIDLPPYFLTQLDYEWRLIAGTD